MQPTRARGPGTTLLHRRRREAALGRFSEATPRAPPAPGFSLSAASPQAPALPPHPRVPSFSPTLHLAGGCLGSRRGWIWTQEAHPVPGVRGVKLCELGIGFLSPSRFPRRATAILMSDGRGIHLPPLFKSREKKKSRGKTAGRRGWAWRWGEALGVGVGVGGRPPRAAPGMRVVVGTVSETECSFPASPAQVLAAR